MSTEAMEKPLILLVDDMPANLHVLAATLKSHYRIKTATDGVSALDLVAKKDKPDLILLDVMMPGMSGIEVMRQLRKEQGTRDIPVIFISADSSEQTQLDGLELGADDYLVKPVASTVLLVRVRSLLQRKDAERKLRLAAHVFESSGEAILISDKDNCIIEVNSAFTQLTGYSLDEIKGKNPKFLSAGRTKRETYISMWESIQEKNFWQGELWDRTKDGRVYPKFITISVVRNAYNDIDFYIGSFTDISERKAAEEHIARLAQYDILTGLLNRFSLQNRMEQAIATAKREQHTLAAIFLDMDRFKLINDTLGHAAGDALLVEVAHRLRASVRESDIVARWGGDEFVIVLTDVKNTTIAENVINKIAQALRDPYWYRENIMHSSPSIGVAFFPDNGKDIDSLMKNADTALYQAKAQGRNNTQFFTSEMNESNMERLWLERDLQVALAKNQLKVYYQPQIDSRTNRVTGFEALLRWHHPTAGLISPAKFIHIAEETGMILALGEWVFNESCHQLRLLRDQGFSDVRMAVNLSSHQLRATTLLVSMGQALQKYNLTGADLELEITESVAMRDPEASIGQLHALRIMGVRLAIDDFGTGYSSLSYLKLLPIHTLKLDQSFVSGIETDNNDTAICSATIALAHNLGLQVIAEGVETEAQRNFLVSNHCDFLQGHLFSPPMPGPEALAFMKSSGNGS